MKHELKTWAEYYEKVVEADVRKRKTVEIRKNDRDFRIGDTLTLIEWDKEKGAATGRKATVLITHIVGQPWMQDDMVALSILLQWEDKAA